MPRMLYANNFIYPQDCTSLMSYMLLKLYVTNDTIIIFLVCMPLMSLILLVLYAFINVIYAPSTVCHKYHDILRVLHGINVSVCLECCLSLHDSSAVTNITVNSGYRMSLMTLCTPSAVSLIPLLIQMLDSLLM